MYKIFDSHIHFNMKAESPSIDFKEQVKGLEGFILILNNEKEKVLFEKSFLDTFTQLFPLSAIAINYELANNQFLEKITNLNIKLGIKLHPRLSNITLDKFESIASIIENIKFNFIIIDCFYYGSNLETHTNLELSIFIAKYFKETKIILAHGGGHKVLEYMLYTRDMKNIYYDFSFTVVYLKDSSAWIDIIKFFRFNENRILFGTDYPECNIEHIKSCYEEIILEALDKDSSKLIYELNYREVLEI